MRKRSRRLKFAIAVIALLAASCSGNTESAAQSNFSLIGSTACDAAIKAVLKIPAETKCDFIRWNVGLDPAKESAFTLDVNFGEGQPNTLGFIGGGQRITAAGKFETSTLANKREIYRLKAATPAIDISLVKLNSNLFHLLMPDGTMMLGNAGWGYTLNRDPALPSSIPTTLAGPARTAQIVFEGRTPCKEIVAVIQIRVPAEVGECFKIKWRITFDRDPATLNPTTFTMETTFNRRETLSGTWTEKKVGDAMVYVLTPERDVRPYSLAVVDENHLVFLDTNERPLVGNRDFSYTLNRRQ